MFSSSSYLPIFWKAMSSRFPLLDLYTRSDKTGFYHLHMETHQCTIEGVVIITHHIICQGKLFLLHAIEGCLTDPLCIGSVYWKTENQARGILCQLFQRASITFSIRNLLKLLTPTFIQEILKSWKKYVLHSSSSIYSSGSTCICIFVWVCY